jgi:hypothetical protein
MSNNIHFSFEQKKNNNIKIAKVKKKRRKNFNILFYVLIIFRNAIPSSIAIFKFSFIRGTHSAGFLLRVW